MRCEALFLGVRELCQTSEEDPPSPEAWQHAWQAQQAFTTGGLVPLLPQEREGKTVGVCICFILHRTNTDDNQATNEGGHPPRQRECRAGMGSTDGLVLTIQFEHWA